MATGDAPTQGPRSSQTLSARHPLGAGVVSPTGVLVPGGGTPAESGTALPGTVYF